MGNLTVSRCCNTANSSSTIDGKFEIMNKRIGSVKFESEVLRITALHRAKPLCGNCQFSPLSALQMYLAERSGT